MRTRLDGYAARLALLVLMSLFCVIGGTYHAEAAAAAAEEADEPGDATETADAPDANDGDNDRTDAAPANHRADEADDEAPDAAAANHGAGEADDEAADDENLTPVEREWAKADRDDAQDAIPTDLVADPRHEQFEVVRYVDDGDDEKAAAEPHTGGIRKPPNILSIQRPVHVKRSKKGAPADVDTPRSAGGKPVPDKGAPWQAQIYGPFPAERFPKESQATKALWQLQHYCGGSLIAHDWVVTAAHCIGQDMVDLGYRVRLGAQDIAKEEGITFKIDRIVRHANYQQVARPDSPNMYANDIALVHIVEDGRPRPRDPSRIREIPLYQGSEPPAGAQVVGTGWGTTESTTGVMPTAVLLKVDLKVMALETCRKLPGYGPAKVHDKITCATNPGRNTCRGDSGGPIIFKRGVPTLVGIISWGKSRCAGDGQPGIYTRVDRYYSWIQQAMKLDPEKNSLP